MSEVRIEADRVEKLICHNIHYIIEGLREARDLDVEFDYDMRALVETTLEAIMHLEDLVGLDTPDQFNLNWIYLRALARGDTSEKNIKKCCEELEHLVSRFDYVLCCLAAHNAHISVTQVIDKSKPKEEEAA